MKTRSVAIGKRRANTNLYVGCRSGLPDTHARAEILAKLNANLYGALEMSIEDRVPDLKLASRVRNIVLVVKLGDRDIACYTFPR